MSPVLMTCNIVSSITNSSISEMNHIRTCTIVNTFGKNRLPNKPVADCPFLGGHSRKI